MHFVNGVSSLVRSRLLNINSINSHHWANTHINRSLFKWNTNRCLGKFYIPLIFCLNGWTTWRRKKSIVVFIFIWSVYFVLLLSILTHSWFICTLKNLFYMKSKTKNNTHTFSAFLALGHLIFISFRRKVISLTLHWEERKNVNRHSKQTIS